MARTYAAVTLVVRGLPLTNNIALLLAVSAPHAVVLPALGPVLAVLGRHVVTSVMVLAAPSVSKYIGTKRDNRTRRSASTSKCGCCRRTCVKAPPILASITELARASADVIALSELTPDWVQRFYASGMRDDFPYSVLVPRPGAGGYGLWSRHPLEVMAPLKGGNMVAAGSKSPKWRSRPPSTACTS